MPRTKTMSFIGHLSELRNRLIRVGIALLLASGISVAFTPRILNFLLTPYGNQLRVLGPTEGVTIYLQVALTCGASATLPYFLFEIWGFIAPGLLPREKRYAYPLFPMALLLFLVGASFAWFILIPTAIHFLENFLPEIFLVQWTSDRYIPFVTALVFWIGVFFELPLVSFFLTKLHVVDARMLLKAWRYAVVVLMVVAAVITPTVDAFNLTLVALPLILLYFISILVAAIARKPR